MNLLIGLDFCLEEIMNNNHNHLGLIMEDKGIIKNINMDIMEENTTGEDIMVGELNND
jgi:hypothetical protein